MRCIYCNAAANTADHVPPRLLLERPFPKNLSTVPACHRCNNGFSLDEQYFLTILAQVGRSPALVAKVEEGGSVDRAVLRRPALAERIEASLVASPDGQVFIDPEEGRLFRVIKKIASGLYYLRRGRPVDTSSFWFVGSYPYNVIDLRPVALVAAAHTETFRPRRWHVIQAGVFAYIFVRMPDDRLLCLMDFHGALWGAAGVPEPPSAHTRAAT
jgi:hypothetical protein